jgi:hypothetical protein
MFPGLLARSGRRAAALDPAQPILRRPLSLTLIIRIRDNVLSARPQRCETELLMKNVTRREFLKYAGIGALGLVARRAAASVLPARFPLDSSDVVQCSDVNATSGTSTINQPVVQVMVDESIKTLAGLPDVGEAWKSFFPDITASSIIGIKAVMAGGLCPVHPAVTSCIVNGLARMDCSGTPFPANNVIVWERTDSELTTAGYTIYDGADPSRYRCFGTNHSGIGYDMSVTLDVNGVANHPSKILSQMCDYLIGAAALKTHSTSSVTLTLKNHYGSVDNISVTRTHLTGCNPYIPALSQQIRDIITPNNIQKLFIVDGLFGLYSGGPSGAPNFNPKVILMSRDPVACDTQGQNVINTERQLHGLGALNAAHITTAAQAPYNLGTTVVNLIEILNPSVGLTDQSSIYNPQSAISVAPLPMRNRATVSFDLDRAGTVGLDLVEATGRVAQALYGGTLGAGRHVLPVTARVRPGTYFLRLTGRTGTRVRKVAVAD